MIQINVGDHSGSENGDDFTPIPSQHLNQVRWARKKAIWIAKNLSRADAYFLSLPNGRSLTNLLGDSSIWINFDPALGDFGATWGNNDLWIGPSAFRIGRWTTLATVIHELAHIDGAPGNGPDAERAVLECGLGSDAERRTGKDDKKTPYDPTIDG
jgi:hypothetical protein